MHEFTASDLVFYHQPLIDTRHGGCTKFCVVKMIEIYASLCKGLTSVSGRVSIQKRSATAQNATKLALVRDKRKIALAQESACDRGWE